MQHRSRAARVTVLTVVSLLVAYGMARSEVTDLPAEVATRPVKIVVWDSVEDGCWTNLEDVEAALTLPMRQSGVQFTTRNEIGDLVLVISALGSRANERLCFGALMIELAQVGVEHYADGSWVHTKTITGRNFSAVSATNLNLQFVDVAESTGRIIANLILEAQQPDLAPDP